jgi:Zn finger protein HypA/HybF involved in hydrogenase expression
MATESPIIQCRQCGGHIRASEATFDGICPTCEGWSEKLVPPIERQRELHEQQEQQQQAEAA